MAVDRACWHDEPVMIIAETRAQAEDAGELVMVDYEELPVVINKDTALNAGSPSFTPIWETTRRGKIRWDRATLTRPSLKPTTFWKKRSISAVIPR